MVEFVCTRCTLWFCWCFLRLLFCHCPVVVLLCCVPLPHDTSSSSAPLWPSKPGILGAHGDGVALLRPFLSSSVSPPLPCVHPLTSIFLSSVSVHSVMWSQKTRMHQVGRTQVCPFFFFPFFLFWLSFSSSTLIHSVCLPGQPPSPTHPHLSCIFFPASLASILLRCLR